MTEESKKILVGKLKQKLNITWNDEKTDQKLSDHSKQILAFLNIVQPNPLLQILGIPTFYIQILFFQILVYKLLCLCME